MRVLITGANGFLAKNLRSYLELRGDIEILPHTRDSSREELRNFVEQADFIFHLAGSNRPLDENEFVVDNFELTEQIISILRELARQTPLLVTSSAQAELDNPYGRSKLAAEKAALAWRDESHAPVMIYRLPGVFGKWCRPNYNSVVATFCYNLTHGLPLQVSNPTHELTLVYVDDVVAQFESHLKVLPPQNGPVYFKVPRNFTLSLDELRQRLEAINEIRGSLVVPGTDDVLNKFLYATYISYLDTDQFAYDLDKSVDQRGWLAEFVKSESFGQVFVSKTKPGVSRGNHWHKTKIEKFLVVEGTAEITFRNKINEQDVICYRVNGDQARVLDIPVGYVHAITNIGDSDLLTIFWASEILDPNNPDTYFEAVAE